MGATMLALGQAHPERAIGLPSAIVNSIFAGNDPRPGFAAPFINYLWAFGGMGATRDHDGGNNIASPYSASATNIPCELQERRYPVLYQHYQLLVDSGGPGRSRGGLGLDQTIEPYQEGTLSNITNRERFGPAGIFGGGEGWTARVVGNPGTEQQRDLGTFVVNVPVGPGEVLSFWSNGGGGYGPALERPLERVLEDIKDGYVTQAAARSTASSSARSTGGAWNMRLTRRPPPPCGRRCAPPTPAPRPTTRPQRPDARRARVPQRPGPRGWTPRLPSVIKRDVIKGARLGRMSESRTGAVPSAFDSDAPPRSLPGAVAWETERVRAQPRSPTRSGRQGESVGGTTHGSRPPAGHVSSPLAGATTLTRPGERQRHGALPTRH